MEHLRNHVTRVHAKYYLDFGNTVLVTAQHSVYRIALGHILFTRQFLELVTKMRCCAFQRFECVCFLGSLHDPNKDAVVASSVISV